MFSINVVHASSEPWLLGSLSESINSIFVVHQGNVRQLPTVKAMTKKKKTLTPRKNSLRPGESVSHICRSGPTDMTSTPGRGPDQGGMVMEGGEQDQYEPTLPSPLAPRHESSGHKKRRVRDKGGSPPLKFQFAATRVLEPTAGNLEAVRDPDSQPKNFSKKRRKI